MVWSHKKLSSEWVLNALAKKVKRYNRRSINLSQGRWFMA